MKIKQFRKTITLSTLFLVIMFILISEFLTMDYYWLGYIIRVLFIGITSWSFILIYTILILDILDKKVDKE